MKKIKNEENENNEKNKEDKKKSVSLFLQVYHLILKNFWMITNQNLQKIQKIVNG